MLQRQSRDGLWSRLVHMAHGSHMLKTTNALLVSLKKTNVLPVHKGEFIPSHTKQKPANVTWKELPFPLLISHFELAPQSHFLKFQTETIQSNQPDPQLYSQQQKNRFLVLTEKVQPWLLIATSQDPNYLSSRTKTGHATIGPIKKNTLLHQA